MWLMAPTLNITELVRAQRKTSQAEHGIHNNAKHWGTCSEAESTATGCTQQLGGGGEAGHRVQHGEHGCQRMSARADQRALCAALRSRPDAGHAQAVLDGSGCSRDVGPEGHVLRRTSFCGTSLYCTSDILPFFFLINCRLVATQHQASLSMPFFHSICSPHDSATF